MSSWCRGLAPLFLVFFVSCAVADETRPVLPTAALESAVRRERAAGVARSQPIAGALLHVAARAPADRRPQLLQLATQADPTLAAPHLARAREALRHADLPRVFEALNGAVRAMPLDARQEADWLRWTVRTAHAWLAAVLATLVILLALRSARLAAHVLGARLGSTAAAAVALLAILVGAFAASTALGTLVTAAIAAPFLRRRERGCLAALCALLAGLEIGVQTIGPRALLLDPRSDVARASRVAAGIADRELEAAWSAAPARTATQEFLLGLQARHRGDLDLAQRRYVACLKQDSTFVAAYVNLANLFFYAGRYDRATVGYRAAATCAPADPIAHYDLAQTYIRTTHYAEADGELAAAAALGMAAAARRQSIWHDDASPVLDATLSKQQILELARAEWRHTPRPALLWAWRSESWRDLHPVATIGLLLAMVPLSWFGLGMRRATVLCNGCKTLVCAHCAALEPADNACSACGFARARPVRGGPDADGTPVPPPPRRVSLASGRWVGALFPGADGLATGAPFGALLSIAVAWLALLGCRGLMAAPSAQSGADFTRADASALSAALVLVGVVWLVGLLRLRHLGVRKRLAVRAASAGA